MTDDLLRRARHNLDPWRRDERLHAAVVTGSVARGDADAASDIDTILYLTRRLDDAEFDARVARARASGGNLYGGTAADGFAFYEMIDGVKCDFAVGSVEETERLFTALSPRSSKRRPRSSSHSRSRPAFSTASCSTGIAGSHRGGSDFATTPTRCSTRW